MASKKNRARVSKDPNPRKYKKKVSPLLTEKVAYVDYKDVDLLSRFISDRAKIRNRRVSGNDVQQQREVANAIKVAREMALIPYARRVSTQRMRPPRDGDSRPPRDGAPRPADSEAATGDDVLDEAAVDTESGDDGEEA
jgi:small subunit ribosomal protein S18